MNINEILAQINALHWAASTGKWQIHRNSVLEWSMYGDGDLISDAWKENDASYIVALHNAYPAIRAELERLLADRWIPVLERMPEEFAIIITFRKRNDVEDVASGYWFIDHDKSVVWCIEGCQAGIPPSHWQPMPSGPKGGE